MVVRRLCVSVLVVTVIAAGLVFASVLDRVGEVVPGFGVSGVAEGQSQVCVWYTERPHKELARRNRVGGVCPAAPVQQHAAPGRRCGNGGAWHHTGNDGEGWWYVSVCAPSMPSGLVCTAAINTLKLSWAATSGADVYRVSRGGGSAWQPTSPAGSTSHLFTGLTAGRSYALRVQAGKTSGSTIAWSGSGSRSCVTESLPTVSTVSSVFGCAATPSSIMLSWAATSGANVYRVSKDGGASWQSTSPAGSTSYRFTGLTANQSYGLQLQAGKTTGTVTAWGASVAKSCDTAFSSIPTGLVCVATATTIRFSWDAVVGADTYTAVLEPATTRGVRYRAESVTARSVSFRKLNPATAYFLSVFAVDGGRKQLPAGKECSTSAGVVNPGRPVCSAVTANSVTLTWNPNSQVYYWYIARAVSGGSFTDGVSLSATTLSKQFTGLSAGTTYQFYFWWRASNADPWVRVLPNAACTTTGSSTSPSAPTCGATTTDSIILNWNANPAVHRWYISRATLSDAVTATTNIS